MTPAKHRDAAIDLLDEANRLRIASPGRADRLAEATVHALLAISAPEPELAPVVIEAAAVDALVEALNDDKTPVTARKSRAKTPKPPTPAAG